MSRYLVLLAIGAAAIHFSGGFKRFFNPRSAKQAGKFLNQTKNTFLSEFNKKPSEVNKSGESDVDAKRMEQVLDKKKVQQEQPSTTQSSSSGSTSSETVKKG